MLKDRSWAITSTWHMFGFYNQFDGKETALDSCSASAEYLHFLLSTAIRFQNYYIDTRKVLSYCVFTKSKIAVLTSSGFS